MVHPFILLFQLQQYNREKNINYCFTKECKHNFIQEFTDMERKELESIEEKTNNNLRTVNLSLARMCLPAFIIIIQ